MTEPAFSPTEADLAESNPARLMSKRGFADWEELHRWSVEDRQGFWDCMLARLGIIFSRPYDKVLNLSGGVENPRWLDCASLNIVDTCFEDCGSSEPSDPTAIVWRGETGPLRRMTLMELYRLSNRVANGLAAIDIGPGDAVAIDMPMTVNAVAIYLGIVQAGAVVVSIADSFAPAEIATRLRIAKATAIFTARAIRRGGKELPLYSKVVEAGAPRAVVIDAGDDLRDGDLSFEDYLPVDDSFTAVERDPNDVINILFSSGTTGDPKAIPWTQTTPIKCAADGYLHQDIRPGHVVCWPTNLGWMMGPWLIFATLINRGTIALYEGVPTGRGFTEFVRDAKVNMLGLVPSLVRAWRAAGATDGVDWSAIHVFSSTGEASNASDMRWLMEQAGGRPVIEYCGGTEIGGGYLTGTVVQPAEPATFTTPAAGLDLVLLDEDGKVTENGEVFLVPPSIGLSTTLLNRDHHEVYFEGTPRGPNGETLRRHGDQLERRADGLYRAHGRTDDTMNLGGIKVSAAAIERVLNRVDGVVETAAVAVPPPSGGPERLVVFAVTEGGPARDLTVEFQRKIREQLNPLFRVSEVRLVSTLPRTASNKVMRRLLRDEVATSA